MLPPLDELKTILEQQLPGVSLGVDGSVLVVASKDLTSVCGYLKDSDRFHFDYLANLTAVDYPPDRLDVVYHLYSMEKRHGPLALRVQLPRLRPLLASVTPLWRGAEFQEREVYDLFGVTFDGHPDLRRILMWEGFQGHPMRKDYVPENQNALSEPP
jgi:NADH/F420H2 dehydrogenase subunit C